ncbi:spermidine/putrescine transport system substrate-binding protein [Dongia mobilis]|uniref:Spermidine/putrescine transport system substrate-binding protein n=1 Tax=Dongia mobilis TaxID=578943 RepID=A0A4R6WX83_9PROT|nr:PotD/PotF family extracellular solute-binding protein [Dongia mobilis]TDQ86414.1 spermidine/putrescine transport system substrate-binding protein [Dongia mobilis]
MSKSWYSDLPKYYQRQIAAMGLDDAGMSRRRMLKAAGAAAGVAAVSGLSFGKPARAATSMSYMCWEGYNDPRIIDPFNQVNDTDIAFDLIVDSPGGFAKLQAGASREVDLVSSDMPWITRMGPAGIAMELNPDDYADVYASFYDQFKPPFEPLLHDGKTIGVATRWGWVGPCVNTDMTDPDEWKSYDPVFDAKNKDKVCVMDWGDWPILPMALHAGIDPYQELDAAQLEEIRKVLRAMFKNTRTLVADLTQAQKGLLDGSLVGCIGAGSYLTSAVRKQGHKNIVGLVPDPKNGLKQGIIWVEATAILKETDQPELAQKLLKHVVSKESGHILSLLDTTCNVVTNKAVEELYTQEEKDILQVDYMWHAWDNSQMHRIAPNIDEMLAIWQEELANAG